MFFKKKSQSQDIMIQWGGLYTYKNEDGTFGVLRLLDFNKDVYHGQLFKEHFDKRPTPDEASNLMPYIWHFPQDVGGLLNYKDIELIHNKVLDKKALQGYEEYTRQTGATEAYSKELVTKLIGFSQKEPLKVRFTKVRDVVTVEVIE